MGLSIHSEKYIIHFFSFSCLRRHTFFQQLKKVCKKSRPSSAGEADFPQIPSVDTWGTVACNP